MQRKNAAMGGSPLTGDPTCFVSRQHVRGVLLERSDLFYVVEERCGLLRGNTMITIAGVPVKTRVPRTVWVIAALLTLLSLSSTLTRTAPGFLVSDQRQVAITHHASIAGASFIVGTAAW